MSQIIQQKVQVRNQKFNTVNGPLALYKGVSILPGGLRALTPIGGLPDGFIADTDVQGQFSIVFNTDALPFAGAVSGTQYYYDDTVAGGSIITTVGPKPLGIGVSGTTSEETGYIILNYKFQTQVPENVVPTPYASLALATTSATSSPVTIIAEVVNAGNPCENGVYAIEPNGDTKKITDPSIFYKDGSNNVFKNTCANLPILSTSTTEPMAIDTATGQIGRTPKDEYELSGLNYDPLDITTDGIGTFGGYDIYRRDYNVYTVSLPRPARSGYKWVLDCNITNATDGSLGMRMSNNYFQALSAKKNGVFIQNLFARIMQDSHTCKGGELPVFGEQISFVVDVNNGDVITAVVDMSAETGATGIFGTQIMEYNEIRGYLREIQA